MQPDDSFFDDATLAACGFDRRLDDALPGSSWTRERRDGRIALLVSLDDGRRISTGEAARLSPSFVPLAIAMAAARRLDARSTVDAETRRDRRILPVPQSAANRVPLLDLVHQVSETETVPVSASRGKGAPLLLRLFLSVLLSVPVESRSKPVVLSVPMRELIRTLWPAGWQRNRDLPKLVLALEAVRRVRIDDLFPVAALSYPPDGDLAGIARFAVAMPPDAASGPSVDLPFLLSAGVSSAPRYRAYVAARTLIWRPGATRVKPARGSWTWSLDERRYPILSRKDMARLAYPSASKRATRAEIDAAWHDLPGVFALGPALDPKTGLHGIRLIPTEAAAKMESLRKTV